MKRFLVFIFSLVFVVLAAIVFVPSFIDWSVYKDQATSQVHEMTGLDLEIGGGLGFSILPSPRFYIEQAHVNAPEGSKDDVLASFERLEVNVALSPLLKGKIKVSSLTLIKPKVSLQMLTNGKINAITPEIEALIGGKAKQDQESQGAVVKGSGGLDISLDQIRIKEGSFSYLDSKSNALTAVQNINMDLSAQSLQGPFAAQGSLFYQGNALNIDVKTDKYATEEMIISPKIKLSLQPGNLTLDYNGVISFGEEGVSVQGQTYLGVERFVKALSQNGLDIGVLREGELSAKGLLTADAKSLSYKNINVLLNEQPLSANLNLSFSPFSYKVDLKTPEGINVASLLNDGHGVKKVNASIKASGDMGKTTFKISPFKIDGHEAKVSGDYQSFEKGKRPKLKLDIKSSKIDYDQIALNMQKPPSGSNSKSGSAGAISASLPMDIDLSAELKEVIWQKKKIKGLSLKGKLAQNRVTLDSLSVQDIAHSSIKASGEVANLELLSGITAYIDMSSPDIRELASWFNVDTTSWPEKVKKANVKLKATGSSESVDVTSNISSMDAQVIAKGQVKTPFSKPSVNGLVLQLKHKNMAQALQMFGNVSIKDKNLHKPLDFYANIFQSGNVYKLNDIKGDLSGISVTGSAEFDLSGKVPSVSGKLDFGKITLQSVVNKNTSANSKAGSSNAYAERWSKVAINTSALHFINADLALSAEAINYGAWPLVDPKMNLKLRSGALEITDLKAGVFDGNIALSSHVKALNEPRAPIHFENKSKFNDVDLGKLSKALIGTKLVDVSGKGSLDLNIKSSGVSPAALIYDLGGAGKVSGTNIILDGVDVERFVRALSDESKPGDTVMGLWKGSTKGGKTAFDTLDGGFVIENGVVKVKDITLDGKTAKIVTNGDINLPKWTLSTKHSLSINGTEEKPSDVPPFEVTFSGSLENPSQTFGQGLLKDYLNRKLQRKLSELLSNKLGRPSNDNAANGSPAAASETNTEQPEPAPAQENQSDSATQPDLEDVAEDAIRGVLEGLLR